MSLPCHIHRDILDQLDVDKLKMEFILKMDSRCLAKSLTWPLVYFNSAFSLLVGSYVHVIRQQLIPLTARSRQLVPGHLKRVMLKGQDIADDQQQQQDGTEKTRLLQQIMCSQRTDENQKMGSSGYYSSRRYTVA